MSSVDTLTSMHSIPESFRYNIIIAITSQNDARHNLDSDIYKTQNLHMITQKASSMTFTANLSSAD